MLPSCGGGDDDSFESRPRPPAPSFFLGGIQVNEEDDAVWVRALEAAGMNTVALTDYARQGDWDSADLTWNEESPDLLAELRAAKALGHHAVLVLRIDLDQSHERNQFLWHGMIQPKGEEMIDAWFERYTRFALQWAAIAEHEGVDVLMIGSELNALASTVPLGSEPALEGYYLDPEKQADRRRRYLEHQEVVESHHLGGDRQGYESLESYIDARIASEQAWAAQVATDGNELSLETINRRRQQLNDRWIELIRRLREVYSGPLGYAANFDQYPSVGFWQELDVMGINAYFRLRDSLIPEARRHELLPGMLRDGWHRALAEIETFRAAQGLGEKPVIFTELGYTYRAQSTLEPWAHTGFSLIRKGPDTWERELVVWEDQPVDRYERALAVRALFETHRELEDPFLRGLLYWKLSTVPGHEEVESFVLLLGRDDPLEAELRSFAELHAGGEAGPLGESGE